MIHHRRRRLRVALPIVALLAAAIPSPARAWITLAEGEKGKLDMEFRLMMWALHAGPDTPLTPGVNAAPPPPQTEDINDFFVRRARFLVRGRISQSLEIALQFGQDNIGSKVLREDGNIRIKEAWVNYKKTEALQLMAGQIKVPFLRQNLQSAFNQLLVDRSLVTTLRPAVEGLRDQGGMIWGTHKGFQYRAAMLDGSDQEDSNVGSSLRGSMRFAYNWFTPEPGAGYTGTTLGQTRILQIAAQADMQNHRTDPRDEAAFATQTRHYSAWAAEMFYDQPFAGRWAVTGEAAWLQRRDDYDVDGLATRSIDGAYAQAGLLLPWDIGPGRLQLVGRWDSIESDRGGVETSMHTRAFGLTWFTRGHDRKIQFDHGDVVERPTDLDDNFYRLSVVAVF